MGKRQGRGIASRIWNGLIAGAEARGRAEAARQLMWMTDSELGLRGLTREDVRRIASGR